MQSGDSAHRPWNTVEQTFYAVSAPSAKQATSHQYPPKLSIAHVGRFIEHDTFNLSKNTTQSYKGKRLIPPEHRQHPNEQ